MTSRVFKNAEQLMAAGFEPMDTELFEAWEIGARVLTKESGRLAFARFDASGKPTEIVEVPFEASYKLGRPEPSRPAHGRLQLRPFAECGTVAETRAPDALMLTATDRSFLAAVGIAAELIAPQQTTLRIGPAHVRCLAMDVAGFRAFVAAEKAEASR